MYTTQAFFALLLATIHPITITANAKIPQALNPVTAQSTQTTNYEGIAKELSAPLTFWGEFVVENHVILAFIALATIAVVCILFLRMESAKRKAISHLINYDEMTGLVSHTLFTKICEQRLRYAKTNEYDLISFDIDYFRLINSMFGLERGSDVIKAMANALKDAYSDECSAVTRITSEQFCVFKSRKNSLTIERAYRDYIEPAIRSVVGEGYYLSMSFGIYPITDCNVHFNLMEDCASVARRKGKPMHGTNFTVFDKAMKEAYERKLDIVSRMESAIHKHEFKLHYQPKVDLNTLKVTGAEALVRWIPENGPRFYPNDFIPIFEANGFIADLDFYVFDETCRFIKENRDNFDVPSIAVNLSGLTLMRDDLVDVLMGKLNVHNIEPTAIDVEITESALFGDTKRYAEQVRWLKRSGFRVSMDDFGAGVSSLNQLAMMDVDVIKLDKAFLDHNIDESKGAFVVESVINMSKQLNMEVVTEGVETPRQAQRLKELGCDIAQGYYFDRPMDENVFKDLLERNKNYEIDMANIA